MVTFALLAAATFFTLVQRAFGTDRWLAAAFARPGIPSRLLTNPKLNFDLCKAGTRE